MSGLYLVSVADKTVKRLNSESEKNEKEGLEWHPSSQFLTYIGLGHRKHHATL